MGDSLLRPLRGEVRKATSLLLVLVIVVFGLSVWRDLDTTTYHYTSQSDMGSARLDYERRAQTACAGVAPTEPHCILARQDLAYNEPLFVNSRSMGRVAAAMGHPAAVVRFVARQASSGAGWLLVAFVAMALVTGERSTGTAEEAVRRLGRPRYVLVKWLAVVLVVGVILAIISIALVLARSSYASEVTAFTALDADGNFTRPVAVAPDPAWTSWANALRAVLLAGAVAAVVAAVAVPFAARSRTMTWFGIGALGVVAVIFAASRFTHGAPWAPMTILDRGANLSDVPPGMRDVRIWDQSSRSPDVVEFRVPHDGSWWAIAGLFTVSLAIAWGATIDFLRRGLRS